MVKVRLMNTKVTRYAYLCDGKPDCYGTSGCGLVGKGFCMRTTDISYAINRKLIMHSNDYKQQHMKKVADSDWEELFWEQ